MPSAFKELAKIGRCAALVTITLGLVPALMPAEGSFTLEQVMSSPFPSELVAAPTGGRVAWLFDARGARNIWVAEPAGSGHYRSRQLTNYAEDDGQDIAGLVWTPDGRSIVYARGGDFENDGPDPNPDSNPAGVEQDVWIAPLDGSAPRKLAEGHSPAVSPHGDAVAYIDKDQVWWVKLDPGAKPEQLIHDKGKCGELRWSPDGSHLAYASRREEHGFIVVYDFNAKSLTYLDPSVDRDVSYTWSPDGKSVAFIRVPFSHDQLIFQPHRAGIPWSIRVADATTGKGHEVWRADAGPGSEFHGIEADSQIFWTAADTLVFPWERTGWLRLYAIPVAGGAAHLLAPGDDFEVEFVSLSPDKRELVFNSNQGDIDRRHLWKEAVDADHPTEITHGDGIEWSPVIASDNSTVALLHSDAHNPARPATLTTSGEAADLAPESMPADFPAAQLVAPQQVIFSAADGLHIHGQLFLPPPDGPGPAGGGGIRRPAVVFFHGGSRRQMLLGWHYMAYYHNAYALNQYLASRGYVVLSVNYRSGIGYGLDFREALNYGADGASEFNDVQGAGLYLRSRPDVDGSRIGLWGGSYGGYLTALGLARASDLFACAVDFHGVHDWNLEMHHFQPSYDPESKPDAARLAWESSPLASISTWRSPVLLIQGDDDRNVPFTEMIRMVEALRSQGVDFQQLVFPNEIHDFLMYRTWLAGYHAASDYLDQHLKK